MHNLSIRPAPDADCIPVSFGTRLITGATICKQGNSHTCAQKRGWEDDSVERHIILAHELNQLHIVWVLPPGPPICHIVGSDADVTNGGVKPHIEDLVLIAGSGDCCTPLQVSSDAPHFQAIAHPGISHLQGQGSLVTAWVEQGCAPLQALGDAAHFLHHRKL